MLQSAQNGASPRVEPPRPGCEFAVVPLSGVEELAEYRSSI